MELVDWNTLGKYMITVPHNKTTNLVKLMHGWQFSTTGRQSFMRTDDDDDDTGMKRDCPLGCGCWEDDHHYLVCQKQPGATHQMQCEMKSLKEYLKHSETHPDMASIIIRSLCHVLEGNKPSLRWKTTTPLQDMIKIAFHKQQRIG